MSYIKQRPCFPPLKKNCLFIWLCQVLVAAHGIQFPDQGLNPSPLHWELGVLATGPPGKSLFLYFFKSRALQSISSAPKTSHDSWLLHLFTYFDVSGLNCSMWDLVPWPGIDPGPQALGAQSPSHWATKEVLKLVCNHYSRVLVQNQLP